MKGLGKAKLFSRGGEPDLLIEAMAPIDGSDEFRSIAFRASRIDYLFQFDGEVSGIALDNGVTIPVAVPFAELKSRIYDNDFSSGDSIDLTLVTGQRVGEVLGIRLSKKFNPAAEEKPSAEKTLDIVAIAHAKPDDREFKRLRFSDADIGHFEPHAGRKERETLVTLKPGRSADGWTRFYLPLPLHHFTYYLNKAKEAGDAVMDISEATRPKDSASLRFE